METLVTSNQALNELFAESLEMDTHKTDYTHAANEHRFNDNADLSIPFNWVDAQAHIAPLTMSENALRQVCSKLGPSVFGKGCAKGLPFDYLQAMKPELRATVLNEHLTRAEGDWFVRAYDQTCRAVLSGEYAAIGNTELLGILSEVVGQTTEPFKVTRTSAVDPDTLNVRIIFRTVTKPNGDGQQGNWGVGVYIGNGETGNRRLRVLPLIQRHSCENSIIFDSGKGVVFIHRGSSATKRVMVRSAMAEVFPWSAKFLDKMIAAEEDKLPDFSEVLDGLAEQYHWDDDLKTKVAIGTEGHQTRFGIVNGITAAARSLKNPDDVADMEVLGGAILLAPGSVFHKAVRVARLTAEKESD